MKNVNDIDDIWERLKEAYGDTQILLANKLSGLNNIENIGRIKDSSKAMDAVSKLINLMKDLIQLSKRHDIQNHLFYGNALERIYRLMGDGRLNRWLIQKDDVLEGEALWVELIKFLEKELKICQQKAVIFKNHDLQHKDNKEPKDPSKHNNQKSYHGGTLPKSNLPSRDITVCFI